MEIAAGGELYDFLSDRKCLEELDARRVFRQIATAVYYCHKNNICHRDLKLENILLDENGNAKVHTLHTSRVVFHWCSSQRPTGSRFPAKKETKSMVLPVLCHFLTGWKYHWFSHGRLYRDVHDLGMLLKVSSFQNDFLLSSFGPKYHRKIWQILP